MDKNNIVIGGGEQHERSTLGRNSGSLVVAILMLSAIYAVVYGLIARYGMGAKLRFARSYIAALIGLPLGFGVVGFAGALAFHRQIQGIGPVILVAFAGMLVMTCVNVILLRTDKGEGVSFIQGFVMQLLPNIVMVAYSIATRPSF